MNAQSSICPMDDCASARRTLRESIRERAQAAYHAGILEVAEAVLVRDGPRDAKMTDIAHAAGVSVGTLYNYFESKEALVLTLIERNRQLILARLGAPYGCEDPCQQLLQFAARIRNVFDEEGPRLQMLLEWADQTRSPGKHAALPSRGASTNHEDWRAEWVNTQLQIETRVRELIRNGVASGELRSDIAVETMSSLLARLFVASLLGYRARNDLAVVGDRFDAVMDLFLHGAASPRA